MYIYIYFFPLLLGTETKVQMRFSALFGCCWVIARAFSAYLFTIVFTQNAFSFYLGNTFVCLFSRKERYETQVAFKNVAAKSVPSEKHIFHDLSGDSQKPSCNLYRKGQILTWQKLG